MPEKFLGDAQNTLMSIGIAGFSGWLSYLLKVQEGQRFTWSEFLLHGAISALCGYVCFEALHYYGYPPELSGALAGVAGWGGTRFIKLGGLIASKLIEKRLGIDLNIKSDECHCEKEDCHAGTRNPK